MCCHVVHSLSAGKQRDPFVVVGEDGDVPAEMSQRQEVPVDGHDSFHVMEEKCWKNQGRTFGLRCMHVLV